MTKTILLDSIVQLGYCAEDSVVHIFNNLDFRGHTDMKIVSCSIQRVSTSEGFAVFPKDMCEICSLKYKSQVATIRSRLDNENIALA